MVPECLRAIEKQEQFTEETTELSTIVILISFIQAI